MPLTLKQRMFADEFLVDLCATKAAIRAGYSRRSARKIGHDLLTKVDISRAIEIALAARAKRTEVTADEVIEGLREVAGRCLQRRPVMTFDRETRGMVQKQDDEGRDVWEFDSAGANRALELLGKHIGMFTDRTKVEGDQPITLVICSTPESLHKVNQEGE